VKVELTGFRSFEKRSNVLNANGALDLGRLTLAIGNLTEVVTVEASGAHVETRNSNYTGILTATQIANIQTKGRDVMSLLRLLPGVRYEDDIEAMGEMHHNAAKNVLWVRALPEEVASRMGIDAGTARTLDNLVAYIARSNCASI